MTRALLRDAIGPVDYAALPRAPLTSRSPTGRVTPLPKHRLHAAENALLERSGVHRNRAAAALILPQHRLDSAVACICLIVRTGYVAAAWPLANMRALLLTYRVNDPSPWRFMVQFWTLSSWSQVYAGLHEFLLDLVSDLFVPPKMVGLTVLKQYSEKRFVNRLGAQAVMRISVFADFFLGAALCILTSPIRELAVLHALRIIPTTTRLPPNWLYTRAFTPNASFLIYNGRVAIGRTTAHLLNWFGYASLVGMHEMYSGGTFPDTTLHMAQSVVLAAAYCRGLARQVLLAPGASDAVLPLWSVGNWRGVLITVALQSVVALTFAEVQCQLCALALRVASRSTSWWELLGKGKKRRSKAKTRNRRAARQRAE
ncbi:uncharacterized protein V1518DRAFT_411054 [Limtongia smithiae]|uniref:uncharacterized protein n=1 Tax=Limtongia smithiae TaxID=1125753 RepID=UPI0034D020B7